jgi:hypothetical protein
MVLLGLVRRAIGFVGAVTFLVAPAWSQTATGLLETSDPMAAYRIIKPVFIADIYPGKGRPTTPYPDRKGGQIHLAGDCTYSDLIGQAVRTELGRRLRLLALFSNDFERDLPRLGFDNTLVRQEVQTLEVESIRTIRDSLHWTTKWENLPSHDPAPYARPLRVFADNLNRSHAGKRLPLLIASADLGCGAGEVPVRLLSSPPGGRIYVVEVFEYRVCEAIESGLGEDLRRCDRWHAAPASDFYPVAGRYRYKIVWPGQPETRSQLYDFSNITKYTTLTLTAR